MTMGSGSNWARRITAATAVALLAGCGSASMDGPGLGGSLRQAAGQIVGRGFGGQKADVTPAAPADPAAMAAEALKANAEPMLMVGMEGLGTTQILVRTDENRGMRTSMTQNKQALIVRDGLVLGTRGLGNDLSTAEIGTEGLIRARRNGTAQRVMRFLKGDGREHALPMTCTVTVEGAPVIERCESGAARIENRYIVGAGGAITTSRQWLGYGLGYVTVQVVRP